MKKVLKKVLVIIILGIMLTLLNTIKVSASVIVKTVEEAKSQQERYLEIYKKEGKWDYSYSPILLTGKEKSLSEANNIEIKYYDESQKELFDYKIEGEKLIITVKDGDLYNLIQNKTEAKEGTALYNKLEKYISNTTTYNKWGYSDVIGLYIKVYYESERIADSQLYYQNIANWYFEDNTEWGHENFVMAKTDEKGAYMEVKLPTILVGKDSGTDSFRYIHENGDYWNNSEIVIFDDDTGAYKSTNVTLNSGEEAIIRGYEGDYIRFKPTLQLAGKMQGDIDSDGKITTKDARLALLSYVGKTALTPAQKEVADVNKDGKVDTKDARQMLLYYVGKIKEF